MTDSSSKENEPPSFDQPLIITLLLLFCLSAVGMTIYEVRDNDVSRRSVSIDAGHAGVREYQDSGKFLP